MKLKGISIFEQHVEKIVLAVMVLVLLGVVSMQFLYQPNLVDAGSKKVPPQAVFGELRKQVDQLTAEVRDKEPVLPEATVPDLRSRFEQAMQQEGGLPEELPIALGPAPRIGGEMDIGPVSTGPIMAMTVPAPGELLGYSQWISADPYVLEENPELAAYLPAEQPYDVVGVTVSGVIDGKAMQELLRDGDGTHRPINSSWIRGGVAVLEVQAERQARNPDGTWGQSEAVERLPGSFDLLSEMKVTGELTPVALREVVTEAEKVADQIVRPQYVPAIAGPEWLEPEKALEREEQLAKMSEVDLLRHRRQRALDRIAQNMERLTGSGNERQPTAPRPGGEVQTIPGKGGMPGAPGNRGGDPRTDERARQRQQQADQRRREQIQESIDKLQQEVDDIEQELADRGFPVGDQDDTLANRDLADEDREPRYLLGNEAFKVWAHDLGVQPGAQYRYRLRVKVNNPIYGKERLLDVAAGDDLSLAKQPYAFSSWSEWTEPVIVGQETYVFLTGGTEAKATADLGVGGTSARVSGEVYHMYYGHYRRGTVSLTPGDSVFTEVRLPDDLYLFDTEKVSKEEAYRLAGVTPEDRRRPGLTPMGPRMPFNPGEEIRDLPPGRGPQEIMPMNPNLPTGPGGGTTATPEGELPEGVTQAPERIAVSSESRLLDVVELPVEVPGGGARPKAMTYAYFETEGGLVEYRRVDTDTQSREYELVRASYRLGEPEEEEEAPTRP